MRKLYVKNLTLAGFRSLREEATIHFPSQGITLIKGNRSGSGKSSIVMAIAFALGFKTLPATKLQNWYSKKMLVRLTLTDGESDVVVTRDPKLQVEVGGETITGAAAELKLAEVMGTNIQLAEVLAYRAQRRFGTFLNATDADKKEMLSMLVGLTAVEAAVDAAEAKKAKAEGEAATAAASAASLTGAASSMQVVSDEKMAEAKRLYEAAVVQLQVDQRASDGDQARNAKKQADEALFTALRVEVKMGQLKADSETVKVRAFSLKSEIDKLRANTCPTCNQKWAQAADAIKAKEQEILALKDRFATNDAAIKNAAPVIASIPELRRRADEAAGAIAVVGQKVAASAAAKDAAARDLSHLTQAHESRKKVLVQLAEANGRAAIAEASREVAVLAAELLGRSGYLGSIFDEVLAEMESRTNDMMVAIPNIARFVARFSSETSLKSGKTKKAISTTLMVDDHEVSSQETSGGQQCAAELCADLALRETVRARSGSPIGWTVLDEAMDGLGVAEKQDAIQMIVNQIGGQVILIDHATEVQEGIASVVEVEFDGRDTVLKSTHQS